MTTRAGQAQDSDLAEMGARITRRRRHMGLSQAGLARQVGRVPASISMIERGLRDLSVTGLVDIARVLNCTVGALLGE